MFVFPGKDGKVYVFRLLDFEGESNESLVRTKVDCKDHKIEKTKGKYLYKKNKVSNDMHSLDSN